MRRAEQIDLREKRFNFLPARFIWRGEAHRVQRVEQVWRVPKRGRRAARSYYQVRCADQVLRLFQDLQLNAWYVER